MNDKQQRQPSSLNSQTRQQISRPISSIHIGKRHRKDMGDIDVLARSTADLGLLQPIVIRPDDRLIARHRRLAAARLLATTATAASRESSATAMRTI